ncbi:ABC transporter permease [Nanoarchaeota archaeon]
MVVSHLKLHYTYLKVAMSTAMEYKVNFITQVLAMALNDVVWIALWWVFFEKFESVGNWDYTSVLMLYALVALSFGLASFFYGNRSKMAYIIAEGRLDFYLTLPKNRLHHLLISRSSFFALGDVLFGIVLACFVVPLHNLPLFMVFVVSSTILFVSLSVIFHSLAFYLGHAEAISNNIVMGVNTIATYPMSVFKGFSKLIILTIIPAGFISGVPVELLHEFNLSWFLMTIGFTIAVALLAVAIFYHGLKRYESGNLLYVRT